MAEAGILERSLSISLGALIFALLLPYMIVVGGLHLDRSLGFPQLGVMWMLLGALLVALGLPLAAWSVYIQHSLGKGTPVPMVPTQRLIVTGPYRYCRNPMAFGTFLAYYGISMLFRTVSGIFITSLLLLIVIAYIKLVEERELAERFGAEYLEYKERTPFFIPRIWGREEKNDLGKDRM